MRTAFCIIKCLISKNEWRVTGNSTSPTSVTPPVSGCASLIVGRDDGRPFVGRMAWLNQI